MVKTARRIGIIKELNETQESILYAIKQYGSMEETVWIFKGVESEDKARRDCEEFLITYEELQRVVNIAKGNLSCEINDLEAKGIIRINKETDKITATVTKITVLQNEFVNACWNYYRKLFSHAHARRVD